MSVASSSGREAAHRSRAVVFGCAGTRLDPWERDFFRDADPMGFILFRRNVETPDQVRRLVDDLRACVGDGTRDVLIDQEGGRVARLGPPVWPAHPPSRVIGTVFRSAPDRGREAARLNGRLLGRMLADLGITIDCAPVADILAPETHRVIGDRAFDDDASAVAALARETCLGLLEERVLPVIKHLPGHGRANCDSHVELPVVTAPRDALEGTDFAAFRMLSDMPLGMTAHIVFRAIDATAPATQSSMVIEDVIRGSIGFDGLLFSDDLSMGALSGGMEVRAERALRAGCDVILHCNGDRAEMTALATAVPALSDRAAGRLSQARALRRSAATDREPEADMMARFHELLAAVGWPEAVA